MLTKQLRAKDLDPILLDQIDLVSDCVVEDEAPADLSWLDEETEGPSGVPFSEMETGTPKGPSVSSWALYGNWNTRGTRV